MRLENASSLTGRLPAWPRRALAASVVGLLLGAQAWSAPPPPPPPSSEGGPPRLYQPDPAPPPGPPPVYVPAPPQVYAPPTPAAPPPPLPTAMRVIYAPFYAAGLILKYGVYWVVVAPLEVLGRTLAYGVEGGVEPDPGASR
jgi:hypothetical protein